MKKNALWILFGVCWITGFCQITFGQQPELIMQTGHSLSISYLEFSPDGKLIASFSQEDKTIRIWEVETGRELRTLGNNNKTIEYLNSIAFSPDSRTLLDSGGRLWNIETGQIIYKAVDFVTMDSCYSIAFSPDGKYWVCGTEVEITNQGYVYSVVLIDASTGNKIRKVGAFKERISAFTFKSDGKLVVAEVDGLIKMFDVANGEEIYSYQIDLRFVGEIALSADNKNLFVASYNTGEMKILNVENGKVNTLNISKNYGIRAFAVSPDGKTLATYSNDARFRLWEISSGKNLLEVLSSGGMVQFNPNGKMFATTFDQHTITLVDASNMTIIRHLIPVASAVFSVVFSPNGKILASAPFDRRIRMWGLKTEKDLSSVTGKEYEFHHLVVTQLAFDLQGNTISSGSFGQIKTWDIRDGRLISTIDTEASIIAFSPDGKLFISRTVKEKNAKKFIEELKIRETKTGVTKFAITSSEQSQTTKFSPDGRKIAILNNGGIFKVYDANSGALLSALKTESGIVNFAYSFDGKSLFVATTTGIKIYDLSNGQFFGEIPGCKQPSQWSFEVKLFPNPQGGTMACSFNNSISLLNLDEKKETFILNGHTSDINSLAFSPDGSLLASASNDASIKLWNTQTGKLLVSLFSIYGNEWIAITPEGFFDGTPKAWKQLIWRFNNNTFDYASVETYFNDFFYPNLLQDVLAGNAPQPKLGSELEKKDRRQPKVEIVSVGGRAKEQLEAQGLMDKRSAAVTVEVVDNPAERKQPEHEKTSGAQDLRLFRNGSLVKVWHGDVFRLGKADGCEQINKANETRRVRCSFEVPIVAGENNLSAYAFNLQNVKSGDDAVSVKGAETLKRDGTLYVLAIGVNRYANTDYNLNFAVPDVVDISAAIKSQQEKLAANPQLKQYAKTEIITLKDETATRENILLALNRFVKSDANADSCANLAENLCNELKKIKPTEPEDALVIYYAGHGVSDGQRFYLLPHNFTGKTADSLKTQGVSDIDLNDTLERVDAGKLLMVIDACQSGQALGAKDEGKAPMNSKGLAQLAYDKGMLILTAAQSQQAALEAVKIGDKEIKHGLLTYALLEAFSSKDSDKDANKQIWEREWFDFAVSQVPLLQREAMKQRKIDLQKNKSRSDIFYVNGDDKENAEDRSVQTPRVFYRREPEIIPFILANQ